MPSATYNTYACHRCDMLFAPTEDGVPPECTRCKHPKCESCVFARPRKVKAEPDSEVVKSVEAKLSALRSKPLTKTAS